MTKIFAHRGFSGKYPENTMLAFEMAIKAKVDGIENDIHFTKDGKIVIIHDETINRTTNGTGNVRDYDLADLRKFNASCGADEFYDFNPIPTIDEYFDLVSKYDIVTNIEIKNGVYYYPNLEEAIIEKIRQYKLEEKIIISSFNNPSVIKAKQLAPEIKCGFLYSGKSIGNSGFYAKTFGVEYIHPEFKSVTPEFVAETKANGIGINTWTVNDEPKMKLLMNYGVDAIITNYPDYAISVKQDIERNCK